MDNLYNRIDALCKARGVTVTRMCKESGASRSALGDLNTGRSETLSTKTLSTIADYFGVSIDDLIGTKKAPADNGEGEMAELLQILRDQPETRMLLEYSKGMSREDVEKIANMIKVFRGGDIDG